MVSKCEVKKDEVVLFLVWGFFIGLFCKLFRKLSGKDIKYKKVNLLMIGVEDESWDILF